MECPVCKTMVDYKEHSTCPVCITDLEIFGLIEKINKRSHRLKRAIVLLSVLLFLFIAAAGAYYLYFRNRDTAQQLVSHRKIRQQQIEIQDLLHEKQLLTASNIDLRNQVQTLAMKLEQAENEKQKTEQKQPAFREISHVVKRGESLQRIALKYYGDKDEYKRIMLDNNISNPNNIRVNQRLKIIVPVSD